jgi:hypothetical protein
MGCEDANDPRPSNRRARNDASSQEDRGRLRARVYKSLSLCSAGSSLGGVAVKKRNRCPLSILNSIVVSDSSEKQCRDTIALCLLQ